MQTSRILKNYYHHHQDQMFGMVSWDRLSQLSYIHSQTAQNMNPQFFSELLEVYTLAVPMHRSSRQPHMNFAA